MEHTNRLSLKKPAAGSRLKTMMAVDFRRLFTMQLLYIMVGICLVVPILVLVMTTMMDGSVSVDLKTGVETTMHAFSSVWQSIGSTSGSGMMNMDMTSMCNINLVYFAVAVLVCLFVSDDFRSGYAKNLFTVRAGRMEYVISKTLVGVVSGVLMLIAYFIGSILGGKIARLPFELIGATTSNIVMCMLAKSFLVAVFVPLYLLMSVIAREKAWLSILLSCFMGMFLFMMVPMIAPLDAGIMNVILCLAGGVLFSLGGGMASRQVLRKSNLV